MKTRLFTRLYTVTLAAALLVPMSAGAQGLRDNVKQASVNVFRQAPDWSKDTLKEAAPVQASFGEQLLEQLKADGRTLSLPEEKIKRLKPGKAPLAAPKRAEGEKPVTFTGMLQYNEIDGRIILDYGFYKFSSANGFKREPYGNGRVNWDFNGRGAYYDHKLHGVSSINLPYTGSQNWAYGEYDADTWKPTANSDRRAPQELIMKGADYDPVTKKVYGYEEAGSSGYVFQTVDYANLERTIINSEAPNVVVMAINKQGEAYGVTEEGMVVKINLTDGSTTNLAQLGFGFAPIFEGMTFDDSTGKLYLTSTEVNWDTEEMFARVDEINTTTGQNTLLGYLPENEEYTTLHVLYTPDDGAPAAINDLKLNFDQDSENGHVTFTMPTKTVGGAALSGNVDYTVTVNDVDANAVTGSAAAGSQVSANVVADKTGYAKAVVVLHNASGDGIRNWAEGWVGTDTVQVHDVTATYNDATKKVSVFWTANATGANGGYAPTSGATYTVKRLPDNVTVADGISATSIEDDLSSLDYKGYQYVVTPTVDGQPSKASTSNRIGGGNAREVPFVDAFTQPIEDEGYTVLDNNGDGVKWETYLYGGSSVNERLYNNYSRTTQSDDWAITPPIHLNAGQSYNLEFDYSGIATSFTQLLEVSYGEGTDPTAYTQVIAPFEVKVSMRSMEHATATINVSKAGDYRIGFHNISAPMTNALTIDNLKLTAGVVLGTPDSVTNVTAKAGENGELTATLEFDAPKVTNDGSTLDELTKITIARGDESNVIGTIDNPQIGGHCTFTDEDASNGEMFYYITAHNSKGAGTVNKDSVYVGYDAPLAPQSAELTDNLDGTAKLQWEAPVSVGQNGGYVDTSDLTYNIYTAADNQLVKEQEGVEGLQYKVANVPQTGDQGLMYYAVSAVNELGESQMAAASPLVYGKPYSIPYVENYKDNTLNGIWSTRNYSGEAQIGLANGASSDGDDWCVIAESEKPAVASMMSGKIDLCDAVSPKLRFAMYVEPGKDNNLKVLVAKNGEANADTLLTADMSTETEEDFKYYTVDLSSYKGTKYIILTFLMNLGTTQSPMIALDDISVRDVRANNLSVDLKAPSRATEGKQASATVTVTNAGENAAASYKVHLFLDGTEVGNVESSAALEANAVSTEEFTFNVPVTGKDAAKLWATVEYDKDELASDNTSDTATVKTFASLLNAPQSLTAEKDGDNVKLNWTSVSTVNNVTDSFEGYDTFLKDGFGDWTTIDRDGSQTAGINGIFWPGAGEPAAFMTFDFEAAGVDMTQYPSFTGHTGSQFLACFEAQNRNYKNNDWLISPKLSGNAQTISLYTKCLGGQLNDTYEVLYSTSDNGINDFDGYVDEVEANYGSWAEASFDLPAGANYFAIHCTSKNGGIFMIDDVSYEGAQLTLTGYNIYRDGKLVGTVDPATTTFDDPTANLAAADHTYFVTAVYEEGESGNSNEVSVTTTGINSIHSAESSVDGIWSVNGQKLNTLQRGVNIIKLDNGKIFKTVRK